jgi:HemY protein
LSENLETVKTVASQGGDVNAFPLAEADFLLRLADTKLKLERNVPAAQLALETAQKRLKAVNENGLAPLRTMLGEAIASLRGVKLPDLSGLAHKLLELEKEATALPLKIDSGVPDIKNRVKPATDVAVSDDVNRPWWDRATEAVWNQFKDIVVIRRERNEAPPLIAREAEYFLRQNLQLELESMRMALLGDNAQAFQDSNQQIRDWIETYFDTQDSRVATFLSGVASPAGGAVQSLHPGSDQSEPGIQRLHDPTASHSRRAADAGNLDGRAGDGPDGGSFDRTAGGRGGTTMRLLIGVIVTLFIRSGWRCRSAKTPAMPCSAWAMDRRNQPGLLRHFPGDRLLRVLSAGPAGGPAVADTGTNLAGQPAPAEQEGARLLDLGNRQLAAGQWLTAEKTLLKGAEYSETPALHYLGAARAIHHINDLRWRRDLHLRRAEDAPDADKLTVQLTRAEFLLDDGDAEQARSSWSRCTTSTRAIRSILQWLAKAYQQLHAWEPLQKLLPEAQKQKALSAESLAELQQQTYRALLESAAASGSLDKLRALWKKTPVVLREEDEAFLVDYAIALCDCEAIDDAETLLREAIDRRWSVKLVVGYGMLGRGNATAQLAAAEGWLAKHGDDPYLLLTLGRLAKRCQQNGKARDYLERSIRLMPTPDAYQELGELLQSLHELTYAGQCFHAGLRLLVGKPQEKQGAMLPAGESVQQLQATAT